MTDHTHRTGIKSTGWGNAVLSVLLGYDVLSLVCYKLFHSVCATVVRCSARHVSHLLGTAEFLVLPGRVQHAPPIAVPRWVKEVQPTWYAQEDIAAGAPGGKRCGPPTSGPCPGTLDNPGTLLTLNPWQAHPASCLRTRPGMPAPRTPPLFGHRHWNRDGLPPLAHWPAGQPGWSSCRCSLTRDST